VPLSIYGYQILARILSGLTIVSPSLQPVALASMQEPEPIETNRTSQ